MTSGNHRFAIVLEDAALYSRIGTVDMMVAQLGHLIGATSLPHVSLGIIPRDIERAWWSSPAFWMFDDGPILLETPSGTVHIRDFMSVKERGSVQHLASEVVGRLAEGVSRVARPVGALPCGHGVRAVPERTAR